MKSSNSICYESTAAGSNASSCSSALDFENYDGQQGQGSPVWRQPEQPHMSCGGSMKSKKALMGKRGGDRRMSSCEGVPTTCAITTNNPVCLYTPRHRYTLGYSSKASILFDPYRLRSRGTAEGSRIPTDLHTKVIQKRSRTDNQREAYMNTRSMALDEPSSHHRRKDHHTRNNVVSGLRKQHEESTRDLKRLNGRSDLPSTLNQYLFLFSPSLQEYYWRKYCLDQSNAPAWRTNMFKELVLSRLFKSTLDVGLLDKSASTKGTCVR